MLNNTITVDPGLNTGIAIWRETDTPEVKEIICPARIKIWTARLNYMWCMFKKIIENKSLLCCYIEGTAYYEENEVSRQALKRGDLFHLIGVSYGYAALCSAYGIDFEFILPSQWKGQMSKQATADRVFQLNGRRYSSDHITDAVGIGFAIQKRLVWRIEK